MKISTKYKRMSEVYKRFSEPWVDILNYDDKSLQEMFHYESSGKPISNPSLNGYYVGKQWMDVHAQMWKEDISKNLLTKEELYSSIQEHWLLDKILK